MNWQQAIEQMERGNKVRHPYFTPDEYIFMRNGKIISGDGVSHGYPHDFRWLRKGSEWNEYWALYF